MTEKKCRFGMFSLNHPSSAFILLFLKKNNACILVPFLYDPNLKDCTDALGNMRLCTQSCNRVTFDL